METKLSGKYVLEIAFTDGAIYTTVHPNKEAATDYATHAKHLDGLHLPKNIKATTIVPLEEYSKRFGTKGFGHTNNKT